MFRGWTGGGEKVSQCRRENFKKKKEHMREGTPG